MIREADVDDYKTNQPLRSTGVKAETEGLMIAAQDQSLPTKSNFARIVKGGTSPLAGYATSTKNIISSYLSYLNALSSASLACLKIRLVVKGAGAVILLFVWNTKRVLYVIIKAVKT